MGDKKPSNPPLFDYRSHSGRTLKDCHGTDITLRDLFAGLAMQPLLSRLASVTEATESQLDKASDQITTAAYGIADRMLAAREGSDAE